MEQGEIRAYRRKHTGFEPIPRALLQDTNLSLEAIGLLCHLQSYPETWKLYKTELYTRFKFNKRTSVTRIWKELILNNYLVEFKKRTGKKYVYKYIFSVDKFTATDLKEIREEMNKDGFLWAVDFEQSKMRSPKPTANKIHREDNTHKIDNTFFSDDDDNNNKQEVDSINLEKILEAQPHLKSIATSLKAFDIPMNDLSEIILFISSLPRTQIVAELINAQFKANEQEAKTKGLTDYKAYFLKGLYLKVQNAAIELPYFDNIATTEDLPRVTLHNWLE